MDLALDDRALFEQQAPRAQVAVQAAGAAHLDLAGSFHRPLEGAGDDEVAIPEFAAASGVSERMLRYVRDGARNPSPATAQAILGALGEMLDG